MSIDTSQFAFPKPSATSGPEPKKREPKKQKPTREITDKTTGAKRIVLSDADWDKLRRWYWKTNFRIICTLCGKQILEWTDFTLDHKEPRGMGGARRQDKGNLRPAHFSCNAERGSRRDV